MCRMGRACRPRAPPSQPFLPARTAFSQSVRPEPIRLAPLRLRSPRVLRGFQEPQRRSRAGALYLRTELTYFLQRGSPRLVD